MCVEAKMWMQMEMPAADPEDGEQWAIERASYLAVGGEVRSEGLMAETMAQ